MLDLGRFPYIDSDDKAVSSGTLVKGEKLELGILFTNTGKDDVKLDKNDTTKNVKITISDENGNILVDDSDAEVTGLVTAAKLVYPGKSEKVASIEYTTDTAGKLRVRATFTNGQDADGNPIIEETIDYNLTVINTDASASGVEVKGVTGTAGAANVFNVVLPYGTDPAKVKASEVVVTPTDDNASVAVATTDDDGDTWKVDITAADGETVATITINVSVADIDAGSAVTPLSQKVAADTPVTVTVVLKDEEGNKVSGLASKFDVTFTGATDPDTVTVSDVTETGTTGVYTFTVENSASETVTFTIKVDGTELTVKPEIETQ